MGNFLNTGDSYTNSEFYTFMDPTNTEFPYVYDSLTKWKACEAQGIYFSTTNMTSASDDTTSADDAAGGNGPGNATASSIGDDTTPPDDDVPDSVGTMRTRQ